MPAKEDGDCESDGGWNREEETTQKRGYDGNQKGNATQPKEANELTKYQRDETEQCSDHQASSNGAKAETYPPSRVVLTHAQWRLTFEFTRGRKRAQPAVGRRVERRARPHDTFARTDIR